MGVEQVIDLAGVLVGRALHDFVIMTFHGDHGAAALEVDAGGLPCVYEVEAVTRRDRDFLRLLRDGGRGKGRLIEPTIIDLIVGVSIAVAQLLEDALAQEGVRCFTECGVEAVPRRYSRDGIDECEARVDSRHQLIVWESEHVPLAHVIGLLDVEELQHVLKSGISRDIQPIRSGVGESARHKFIDRGKVGEFMVETAGEARVGEGVLDVHDA